MIALNYGGPRDYLGEHALGLIPYRLVPCPSIPGYELFNARQHWPEPDDTQALALMRDALARPQVWDDHARCRAQQLAQRFADAPLCAALEVALGLAGDATALAAT